jgi:hypothetical protein
MEMSKSNAILKVIAADENKNAQRENSPDLLKSSRSLAKCSVKTSVPTRNGSSYP